VLKNITALTDVCTALLDSIFKHVQECPVPIRRLCAIMHNSVLQKYPQHGSIAIGSFFFLRFMNPALTLPEQYALVPSVPNPDVRRSMILITKVLQQLANEVDTFKEQYMAPFGPFVRKHKEPLRQFYHEICSCQDEVGFLEPDFEAEFSCCPDLNASMKSTTSEEKRALYKLFHDKKNQISERLPQFRQRAFLFCARLLPFLSGSCKTSKILNYKSPAWSFHVSLRKKMRHQWCRLDRRLQGGHGLQQRVGLGLFQ
jgi:hypothetical protein